MSAHRDDLPHASGEAMLSDGGLETTMIFEHGMELPDFASFPLLETEVGRSALLDYYRSYADIAARHGAAAQLDTPTWRATADWGAKLGYDAEALHRINTMAVEFLKKIRDEYENGTAGSPGGTKVVISGQIGPRGDGYEPGEQMSAADAEVYHSAQIKTFAGAGADLVTALTMSYVDEGIGVAKAAAAADVPSIISFTVETDGSLPTGQPLGDAISQVDAATGSAPLFYGINCAHPDHFNDTLSSGGEWVERIGLLRANASRMSHEELDNSEVLDAGDPQELGSQYSDLRDRFPGLVVLGGCCGTDHRHIAEIAQACL